MLLLVLRAAFDGDGAAELWEERGVDAALLPLPPLPPSTHTAIRRGESGGVGTSIDCVAMLPLDEWECALLLCGLK